jgi:hypothetical protein
VSRARNFGSRATAKVNPDSTAIIAVKVGFTATATAAQPD